MPSPRIALAAAAFAATFAAPAIANDDVARNTAIAACRAAVAPELGVEPGALNLDRIETKARTIKLRLQARKDGARVAADCVYARTAGTATVAVIAGPAQAATGSAPGAAK